MNILDWVVLIIIAYTTLNGIYRGFIHSGLSLVSFFLSWFCAAIFAPATSRAFLKHDFLYPFVYNYTEGSEWLTNFENSKLLVSNIPADEIQQIITDSNLPAPFASLMRHNITNQVFSGNQIYTLGDYYNYTISNVCINILSFFIVFFLAKIVFNFINNSMNYTLEYPMLKRYDGLTGGVFGFFNGIFITYAVFILIPLMLIVQPVQELYDIVYQSFIAKFFYTTNFILNFIRGVV